MKLSRTLLLLATATAFGLTACATGRPLTDAERGAIIGAASGAVLGGIASKNDRKKGVLLGAVGGGIAGAAVGHYMDKQKQDLEKVLTQERSTGAIQIEKMQGDVLRVTMTDQTAFEFDSAEIKPGFYSTMDKISEVVNRYGKTHLTIVGHTDNVGTAQYNQKLSERRAQSVQQYFGNRGVIPERLAAEGRGLAAPRASNATPEGRRLNRRVEIYIEPIVAEA
ncbi:flagellar motor protein MotB [Sulfurifustis variabilis]|uniref:Flagellar motor protein MotB n=1 Tax=Sulfurifustis variabilis TaxID=1675686 RepID=A0A1B4V2B7_9GAMM|nr:OmpA family protein [Sulfurifustis variabilis]BAU47653.1 flagellar motor protein MotB [Sulfurifustis variabilis]